MLNKRRSRLLLAVTTVIVVVTALGVSASGAFSSPARHTLHAPDLRARAAAAAPTTTNPCGYQASVPADSFKGIPVFNAAQAAQPFNVTFITTQGIITVRMLTTAAPCATFSFRFLATRGFYNLTHCHRLTTQGIFVLQCGDPTGTGSGGPGYEFNDENLAGATYPAGTLAMANAGPNTNGSQFFFTWQNTTLAPDYTPFGTVIAGMNVLQRIAAAGDDNQNGPGDGYPTLYTALLAVLVTPAGL
jgi:peptidyl-prolyl cis-trans isomerase B (cyclophilin B)